MMWMMMALQKLGSVATSQHLNSYLSFCCNTCQLLHSSNSFYSQNHGTFYQVRELGLAVMLLGVVVVFLLCNVLALIANLLEVNYILWSFLRS